MKRLFVACLVMLVSACASTTGKNTADLGAGAGKQSSGITSEAKSPAASAQGAAAGGAATAKGANGAKDAAGQSGNSPAGTSSGAAAGAGTDAGPGQSGTGAQTGSSAQDAAAGQPEVSSQPHGEADMKPLDGQSASGTDGAAASSAQGGSPSADATSAGSSDGKGAADSSAAASSASAAGADKTGAAGADKTAAAGADKTAAAGKDKSGTPTGGANDGAQAMPHEVVDPSVSGTVTEQQLKAANPMLAERSVFYDFDKYEIKDQYAHIIEAHANFLVEHPTVKVFIEGNCDDRGSPEYNMVLGQRRAESVLKAMQALGVAAKQMEAVSFGAERPVAHGHDEDSWVKNRRSDIVYPLRK